MPATDRTPALGAALAGQGVPESLQEIVAAIAAGALDLAGRLRRAQAIAGGTDAGTNRFGEAQTPLDVLTDRLFRERLAPVAAVAAVATEESSVTRSPLPGAADVLGGTGERFLVVLDPLDGSKNFDIGGPLGTIFGVLRDITDPGDATAGQGAQGTLADVRLAGYVLYSWVPVLVVATAAGVVQFVADADLDGFAPAGDLRIPDDGGIYSLNEGHRAGWPPDTAQAIARFTAGRSTRYTGCFVADVHRVLAEGGIYAYPPTASHPRGKLRLFYEVLPLGFVVRAAGGAAATDAGPLEVQPPGGLDDTTPVYIGSRVPVAQALGADA